MQSKPSIVFVHGIWAEGSGFSKVIPQTFAGDLSAQEQKVVWATHGAPAADLFNQKATGTAWRSKPSWYIVANNDRTVQPELQRFVAKRMGATIYDVDSSHVPCCPTPVS